MTSILLISVDTTVAERTQQKDKISYRIEFSATLWLSSAEISILYFKFSPGFLCYADVYKCVR
jgi:hypothetical protein